jgi:hypothetical protein
MKLLPALALVFLSSGFSAMLAQEQARVPKDSARIAIPGCTRDRVFIVADAPNHEPVGTRLEPGRRFRLAGKREVLDAIKAREGTMVEVTGLVRKSDLEGSGGVRLFGGRVRIGGGAAAGAAFRRAAQLELRRGRPRRRVVSDADGVLSLALERVSVSM